jgi:hypothetical protein
LPKSEVNLTQHTLGFPISEINLTQHNQNKNLFLLVSRYPRSTSHNMARRTLEIEELQRMLREEREGREADRRRLQEEQQARQKAEEDKQKAEEDKQKAEEDKQKAEEDKQKAEEDKQKEQQARQKAEERAQKAEELAQDAVDTTFQEYLDLCHIYLHTTISIQTDRQRSTKGGMSSHKNKYYPNRLCPWEGFLEGQRSRFDEMYDFFHPPSGAPKLFPSRKTIEQIGRRVCDRRFASEDDLRGHQQFAIESPIGDIVSALKEIDQARERFNLGDGVIFENHTNTLDDDAEEVQERLQAQQLSDSGQTVSGSIKPDRICVFRTVQGKNTLSFVIEYKPAHKLSVTDLELGLHRMNLYRDVVVQYKIPTDEKMKQKQDAEKRVASVVTQTFHYMTLSGLEYSYISIGKAFVFLWIKDDDPTTVYYHLVVPNEELHTTGDPKTDTFHTALGQVLCFSLLAFGSENRDVDSRGRSKSQLQRWPVDESVLPRTPEKKKKEAQTPPTSDYKGKSTDTRRSYNLRPPKKPAAGNRCNEDETNQYDDSEDDSEDDSSPEDESRDTGTPTRSNRPAPARPNRTVPAQSTSRDDQMSSRTRGQTQRYCTQACLLGLVRGDALDEGCPNVSLHRTGEHQVRHVIDVGTLARLVRAQLGRTLNHDCEPLGKQGARGALFKVTLASYGYTFVGKGTISVFVPDLQHEGRIYGKLKRIQGEVVPVYLGNIDLIKPYLDFGVQIVHMLLMSWGGEVAEESRASDLEREVCRSVREISDEGVEHNDVRTPNILWNAERGRAMLIDFERSSLLLPDCLQPLQELSPNRKRKRQLKDEKLHQRGHSYRTLDPLVLVL